MDRAERERESFSCQACPGYDQRVNIRHKEFNHQAGRAIVHSMGTDVWSVRYSGVISPLSFNDLRRDVLHVTQGAQSMILRMDSALTLLTPRIPEGTYAANTAPGVVVVRPDQYPMWAEYARRMARLGVIRAVVLQTDLALARRLMDCFAGRVLPELPAVH